MLMTFFSTSSPEVASAMEGWTLKIIAFALFLPVDEDLSYSGWPINKTALSILDTSLPNWLLLIQPSHGIAAQRKIVLETCS